MLESKCSIHNFHTYGYRCFCGIYTKKRQNPLVVLLSFVWQSVWLFAEFVGFLLFCLFGKLIALKSIFSEIRTFSASKREYLDYVTQSYCFFSVFWKKLNSRNVYN